ncbi:MAG: hypothetical protein CVU51_00095 [Deltaproteobacteria bacterium HGW-Deltaproteobacteria-1]|jgi:hypothetical protein|nr:MAG: hypothetical protein CVU51_00095 [Deltaproteobacteria bacterium HGW-Deltaproteobacteria-1]
MRLKYLILAVMMALAGIAGCSPEPRSVTMHEPGVYKGAKDPLLALKNQQELIDRFKLVQTDR